MGEIFQKILDMSLVGCYSIFIVMAVRLLLSKCGRKYAYYLWFVVFLNLCIPFSFQGIFSLIPNSVAEFSVTNAVGSVLEGAEAGNKAQGMVGQGAPDHMTMPQHSDEEMYGTEVNGTGTSPASPEKDADGNAYLSKAPAEETLPLPVKIATGIWLAGIVLLLAWSLVSTLRLRKQISRENWVRFSRKKGIAQVTNLNTPFLWGIFKPTIYLPTDLEEDEIRYVVAHEQYHKKRKDHLVKIVVFFVVVLHWFNPFVWIAYSLFCRDMEISCDEAVLLKFKGNIKKQYAGSLLKYAAKQSGFTLSPITFGEPAVKSRIKNVLGFKRRGIMLSFLAVICVVSVAAGLVLRPSAQTIDDGKDSNSQSDSQEDRSKVSNNNADGENGNSMPSSVEKFKAILLENDNFVCADWQNREVNLAGIKAVVTDEEDVTVRVDKFTIVDLDGDGENEVVLWILYNGDSYYGFEVLHYQEETVYGNTFTYRAFYDLKVDGTFWWSGGAANSGIGRLTFTEDGRAVREEFTDDVDNWNHEKQADVTWYDLSEEGVNMAFENASYSAYSSGGKETGTDGWYGSYIATDFIIRGVTAMGSREAEGLMSCLLKYSPNEFDCEGIHLESPVYEERIMNREDFETYYSGSGGGYTFEDLGIQGDSLLEVTISNSYEFGNTFYVCGDGRILIHHPQGVFFIAERGQSPNIVLSEADKTLLQLLCYNIPAFSGYLMTKNEDFWREFIFRSFTNVPMDENGNYRPIYGEGEHVTIYRDDLGFEEEWFKISETYVQEYAQLIFGWDMPQFHPAFEDMVAGQTALYYQDGYYFIGDSDVSQEEYRFRDVEVFQDRYDTSALVRYDILTYNDNGQQKVVGTVQFHLSYAENAHGFTIVSKEVERSNL